MAYKTVNDNPKPTIQIIEQPASRACRFRYESEHKVETLLGANTTATNKTYPTIKIFNYDGPAVVVVSCVTNDEPHWPHPHKLVGKDGCKEGICNVKLEQGSMTKSFKHIGIQYIKKKNIEASLKERERRKVDPCKTGFDHINQPDNIDMRVVRLGFQAFVMYPNNGTFVELDPAISNPIYDRRNTNDLIIYKLSVCSGSVKGDTEVILLCEKINKDDIKIRFYEEVNEMVVWESFAKFNPVTDVHKNVAVTFRTPAYKNKDIRFPVEVNIQLLSKSTQESSEPRSFEYIPIDPDSDCIEIKRKKQSRESLQQYLEQNIGLSRTTWSESTNIGVQHGLVAREEVCPLLANAAAVTNNKIFYQNTSAIDMKSIPFMSQASPLPASMYATPNLATTTSSYLGNMENMGFESPSQAWLNSTQVTPSSATGAFNTEHPPHNANYEMQRQIVNRSTNNPCTNSTGPNSQRLMIDSGELNAMLYNVVDTEMPSDVINESFNLSDLEIALHNSTE